MDVSRSRHIAEVTFALVLAALLTVPALAFAQGTGDDPRATKDSLTATESAARAAEEARFGLWRAGGRGATASAKSASRPRAAVIDAPYRYLYTPSHAQERSYWCGPATCQIVTHYWGRLLPQSTFAAYLGTTSEGTDFSKVDDCLRYFTNKAYYYYGGVSTWSEYCAHLEYGIGVKRYPIVADVVVDGSYWPFYVYDHSGHILPIDSFDFRYLPYRVRVNDPYDEATWRSGGGDTFGSTTYAAYFIWNGIQNHWRRAIVR